MSGQRILSIKRVDPSHRAPATSTGPSTHSTGCSVSGSAISKYSTPASGYRANVRQARAPVQPLPAAPHAPSHPAESRNSARHHWCNLALRRRQMLIARTQRETILFPNRRHRHYGYRDVQVFHHTPDNRELLRVFLAEVRAIRLHYLEQASAPPSRRRENARAGAPRRDVRSGRAIPQTSAVRADKDPSPRERKSDRHHGSRTRVDRLPWCADNFPDRPCGRTESGSQRRSPPRNRFPVAPPRAMRRGRDAALP